MDGNRLVSIRLTFAVLALLAAATLWPVASTYVRDWTAIDACLDDGGSFDHARLRCDSAASHPYVSFRRRHATLVGEAGLRLVGIMVIGLALAVGHDVRQRRSRRPTV